MAYKTRNLNYETEIIYRKAIKNNHKTNIKKENKCQAIRSYEVESSTNQMLKDEIMKKNQLHKII